MPSSYLLLGGDLGLGIVSARLDRAKLIKDATAAADFMRSELHWPSYPRTLKQRRSVFQTLMAAVKRHVDFKPYTA